MIVCSCRAVSDRTVRAAVASGARSVEDVADRCGAGAQCGSCWPSLARLLEDSERANVRNDGRRTSAA